jgi:hypothetical protein
MLPVKKLKRACPLDKAAYEGFIGLEHSGLEALFSYVSLVKLST